MALLNAARRQWNAGHPDEARLLRQHAQRMASRDPDDPAFRRLWYVRYADDFLVGFSGPRERAEQIKQQLQEFLNETLKLDLSQAKALITHARTETARFLGDEIVTLDADCKHDHRGQRCINGAPGLKVPATVIGKRCSGYMRRGQPIHLAARRHETDFSIVTQYQAEYRGLVQYDLIAFNAHHLWQLHWVMSLSLVKTLANEFRTSVRQIRRKHQKTMVTLHGTQKVLEVVVERGAKKKPLVARFGGIELRWQKSAILDEQPSEGFSVRSEVVQRLLAKSGWRRAAARCWSFAKRAMRPFIANGRAGIRSGPKPLESRGEIERLMPGSEEGGWKRAAKAAPRWPPTQRPVRFDERGVETER